MTHAPRPRLASRYPVHVTLRVRPHVYQLRSRRCFRILAAALLAARERHGARICHFSVQGNHLHLLVEARDAAALGRAMKGLGVRIARGLNRLMGTRGPVLADRYHARILRTPREVRSALAYVLGNHRHHARQWAPGPAEPGRPAAVPARRGGDEGGLDPFSSARGFDGWRRRRPDGTQGQRHDDGQGHGHARGRRRGAGGSGAADVTPPEIAVAAPRSWLLSVGWRRHGLLEPA